MALSEKTVSKHNIKRAEVFKSNGLCNADVAFAHPQFKGENPDHCCLCGTAIKYNFAIFFAKPDAITSLGKIALGITRKEEVTLLPVGSECIQDWLDAVPESAEKLEALKRWKNEFEKLKTVKKEKAIESALAKLGTTADAVAESFEALHYTQSNKLVWGDRKKLRKLGYQATRTGTLTRRFGTPKALKLLVELIAKAAAFAPVIAIVAPVIDTLDPEIEAEIAASDAFDAHQAKLVAPVAPVAHVVTGPVLTPEVAALLERGRDVFRHADKLARLNKWEQDTLASIGKKVKHYTTFASAAQRGLFEKLVVRAETAPAAPVVAAAPVVTTGPKSGEVDFASASGIAGARY